MNNLQNSTSMSVALGAVRARQYVVVSLDDSGMFSMSARPTFQPGAVHAQREAARLAAMYPGKAFVVVQLTGGSLVPVTPAVQSL